MSSLVLSITVAGCGFFKELASRSEAEVDIKKRHKKNRRTQRNSRNGRVRVTSSTAVGFRDGGLAGGAGPGLRLGL